MEKKLKFKTLPMIKAEIIPHTRNYEFEIISKNIVDRTVTNEEDVLWYVSEQEALEAGVKPENIEYKEDDISKDCKYVYRYEYNITDPINIENAKRFDFGVLKMLQGDFKGVEYMFPLENNMGAAMSIFCYGYVTHGIINKKFLNEIKKKGNFQKHLLFVAKMSLFNEIMSIKV